VATNVENAAGALGAPAPPAPPAPIKTNPGEQIPGPPSHGRWTHTTRTAVSFRRRLVYFLMYRNILLIYI
jgi:hypothetical protein